MATETDTPINMAAARAVAWHEVNTRNVEKTVAFYTSLLGWDTEAFPMGEMGTYTMFKRPEGPFCGIVDLNTMGQPGVPAHWAVYFNCSDVDADSAKAVELGAKVLVPAFDVPTVGRMALIQDPEGATFWLFKGVDKAT